MSLKKIAILGIKWTSLEKIGKSIFQLLQVVILTKFLNKEAFGLIAIALVVISFSNIFVDRGFTSAILHKQNATRNEYSSIYWLNIFIAIVIYLGLFFLAPFISNFYGENELLDIIPVLGLNILFVSIGRQHQTILQKNFKFKNIAIVELISVFCGLIFAVILAIQGYGVYSLVYSTLLKSAIAHILFLILNIKGNPLSFYFTFKEVKPFIKVGGFHMASSFLGFFSKEIDILIIGRLFSTEVLGVYSLSKQIVLRLYSILTPIVTNVLSPLLSSIQNEPQRLKNNYLKITKYLVYVNFPIYLLIIVSSNEILHYLYGSDYTSGTMVLSFLAISYCVSTISNPVGSLQIATGRTDIGFYWTILRIIVTPIFIYIGGLYSIDAVALVIAVLSLILIVPMWYIQLRPLANIMLLEYLRQFYKPLILFILISYMFLFGNVININEISILMLIVKQILAISVFVLILLKVEKKSLKEFYKFGYAFIKKKYYKNTL